MAVVVMKKPKEKRLEKKGWRTKTKTKTVAGWNERKRISEEKMKVQRAAHNAMLLRVRGVRGPREEAPGLLERLGDWMRSLFKKKKGGLG